MPVSWPDEVDEVLGGDITAALAYLTPAGGAVVTAVAPVGLRDRAAGVVTFTTSLGFGRKLERLKRDPRVALAYHAREHGFVSSTEYVLVQGTARPVSEPDEDWLEQVLRPQAARFMGPPKKGRLFWDRWLREYYQDRVRVDLDVERVLVWPGLDCAGEPSVHGSEPPAAPPEPQAEPAKGTAPRADSERAAERLRRMPHVLLAWRGAGGHPMVAPVSVKSGSSEGIELAAAPGLLPPGGRRAGLLGHDYQAKLIGLEAHQHTGWVSCEDDRALYAPHTEAGFKAPPNKTLLLLGNGFLAKRNLKRARREGRAPTPG